MYPLSNLQGLARPASSANPVGYIVSGVRDGLLGQSEVAPFTALAVLAGASLVAVALVPVHPRRGDGLTE